MTFTKREEMKALEELNRINFTKLAADIIRDAYNELEVRRSISASQFFGSDWFSYLCSIVRTDHVAIRKAAYKLPGYVTPTERRAMQRLPRTDAIKLGRRRRRRGKPLIKLTAFPPEGSPSFEINGYVNAAQLLGCSAAAIKNATDQGRPCMGGWKFEKR